ncbi:MAG: glycoside hydrolase family 92 protein, partial [Paenibacillus sp.]|nr:glycoside hydrolase family 92 protein [Paenibacillus sp.]
MNYYLQKSGFDALQINQNDIEFFGDSLTDYGQWSELFPNTSVKNRGITGDDTERLLNRLSEVGNPAKLLIMAGTNDL